MSNAVLVRPKRKVLIGVTRPTLFLPPKFYFCVQKITKNPQNKFSFTIVKMIPFTVYTIGLQDIKNDKRCVRESEDVFVFFFCMNVVYVFWYGKQKNLTYFYFYVMPIKHVFFLGLRENNSWFY